MPFPYTFPFSFEEDAEYAVYVDWDNDGVFTEAIDDITSDVKEIRFSRGKDSQLGKASPGQLMIRVRNDDKKYSPEYSLSPLHDLLLPKRPIKVMTLGPIQVVLFYGFIEDIIPHPHWAEKDAHISAVDGLDFLARAELDTALSKNALTGALVEDILDAAGWSTTMRTIDAGQDTVPFGYWHQVSARYALQEIEDSEHGFVYVNGKGYLAYEDRHHRYSVTHQTPQGTFDNTTGYKMQNLAYDYGAKNIYNLVRATVTPWTLQSIGELWRLQETPLIPAGDTLTWWGNFLYFADAITTPAATTDYTANTLANGTGTDKTTSIAITTTKFAQAVKLEVKNNATVSVYLTLLKVRGTYYDDQTTVSRQSVDSTSQTAFQKRTLTLDAKFLTNADKAQDYCDYALARFKDPQAELTVSVMANNTDMLKQILNREISDRVRIVSDELGMTKDFFIDYMEHEITEGGASHRCTWRLSEASNEMFWVLDYSALDTGTKVCY